jgi:hypothetical protein
MLVALSMQAPGQFNTPAESLEKHVHFLASDQLLGRGFGTPQGKEAAEYIARQFKEAGVDPLNGTYFQPFMGREGILNIPGINVVGLIPGNDPALKEEYIVLGAHFDHLGWFTDHGDTIVYNGADDNASGTASIIEIGRNLAASQASLGRSVIVVAFDGEESGLIGSRHFLNDSVVPPHTIKLMFSLDMVGMYEAHKGLNMKGVNLLYDAGLVTGELAGKYNITISKANKSIEQRTDTAPFGAMNIPAIAPNTGSESPYHKPEDTAEALDYEGMARITNYMSEVTQVLSSHENLSAMTGLAEGEVLKPEVFSAGLRWNVGSSKFNYRNEPIQGNSIFATQAGVFTSFRLSNLLYLMPEVLYETKGSQYLGGKIRTHAFTFPVSLAISSPDEGYVRVWVQAGAYFSQMFAGKQGDQSVDFYNDFLRQEYGICYGIGMEAMHMLQMGIYFQHGLSDLTRDNNPAPWNLVHQNMYFSLGWVF